MHFAQQPSAFTPTSRHRFSVRTQVGYPVVSAPTQVRPVLCPVPSAHATALGCSGPVWHPVGIVPTQSASGHRIEHKMNNLQRHSPQSECSVSTAAPSEQSFSLCRSRALTEESIISDPPSTPEALGFAASYAACVDEELKAKCGVTVGAYTMQGTKGKENQDTYLVLPLRKNCMLVGVFDGHGFHGQVAATRTRDIFAHAARSLVAETSAQLSEQQAVAMLQKLFELAHSALALERDASGQPMAWCSGTTATAAILDMDNSTMACAHVGDSALLLSNAGSIKFQTRDHVVDEQVEQRVVARGGEVREEVIGGITARRIFANGAPFPGIMMSRSLGDLLAHDLGMLSVPDIITGLPLAPGSIVVLASDGLWDYADPKLVMSRAAQFSGAQEIAKTLVQETRALCSSNPLIDDITAVVVVVGPTSQ